MLKWAWPCQGCYSHGEMAKSFSKGKTQKELAKHSLLAHEWLLIVCAENNHHHYISPNILSKDYSPTEIAPTAFPLDAVVYHKPCLLVYLYITLPPCSAMCNNLPLCFTVYNKHYDSRAV